MVIRFIFLHQTKFTRKLLVEILLVSTTDILSWVIQNSRTQIIECFLYWATQGLSFFRRDSVFKDFKRNKNENDYVKNSIENETTELFKLYGGNRKEIFITELISNKDQAIQKEVIQISNITFQEFKDNSLKICKKLKDFVPFEKTYSHCLEEEQELELEVEEEEEKELERPAKVKPLENRISSDLLSLIQTDKFKCSCLLKLPNSLDKSSLKKILQHKAWSTSLFTTEDFVNTVRTYNELDCYLRPPRWLCIYKNHEAMKIIIMSDYEANQLFSRFEASKTCTLALLLPRCRQDQERIISFPSIIIPQYLLEQIAIYSGSLYLRNKEEQDAFLSFTSYCPTPRSAKSQEYFENNLIKNRI